MSTPAGVRAASLHFLLGAHVLPLGVDAVEVHYNRARTPNRIPDRIARIRGNVSGERLWACGWAAPENPPRKPPKPPNPRRRPAVEPAGSSRPRYQSSPTSRKTSPNPPLPKNTVTRPGTIFLCSFTHLFADSKTTYSHVPPARRPGLRTPA